MSTADLSGFGGGTECLRHLNEKDRPIVLAAGLQTCRGLWRRTDTSRAPGKTKKGDEQQSARKETVFSPLIMSCGS